MNTTNTAQERHAQIYMKIIYIQAQTPEFPHWQNHCNFKLFNAFNESLNISFPFFLTQGSHKYAFLLSTFNSL